MELNLCREGSRDIREREICLSALSKNGGIRGTLEGEIVCPCPD
jgi:hypothetical protein